MPSTSDTAAPSSRKGWPRLAAISRPADVDARADLYARGAVACYLLVGEPVFTGQTIVEVFGRHLHSAPTPPSERTANDASASLEQIILRCLEKDPARRFPSARELLAALNAAAGVAPWTEDDASRWWTVKGNGPVKGGAGQ